MRNIISLKPTFLVFLCIAIAISLSGHSHVAAKGEESSSLKAEASTKFRGIGESLIHLPVNVLKLVKRVVSVPIKLPNSVLNFATHLIVTLEHIGTNSTASIIALIDEAGSLILGELVAVGVLGGTTIQDVLQLVQKVTLRITELVWFTTIRTSAYIMDDIEVVLKNLNIIFSTIMKIAKLPVIKNIVEIITPFKHFIKLIIQTQIDTVRSFVKDQLAKHEAFFKPILDGLSSRILIVTNALHALVNGDLHGCEGHLSKSESPTGNLQLQLNIWIDMGKVTILRILGLSKLADSIQAEVDELSSTGADSNSTGISLPPHVTANTGVTSIPFGSVNVSST